MTGPDSIYDETRTPYDNLERVLRARGYRLAGENDDVTLVTGLGVCGAFAPPHSPNERFANRFLADHSEAFNKWSQVPVAVTLPTTQDQLDRLLGALEWVASLEGYRASNEFDHAVWIRDP